MDSSRLTIPSGTDYAHLGVGPEAPFEEIRDAKTEVLRRVTTERAALERRIKEAESKVPDLEEARRVLKTAQDKSDDRSHAMEEARRRVSELETLVLSHDPRYKENRMRATELDREEIQLNQISLDTPEQRRKYDSDHPPLGLLKLEDATTDGFTEGRLSLKLIRRAISEHLQADGEEVTHPSDLLRTDFTSDYAWNPLIDGK